MDALGKFGATQATLTLPSCSPNFPCASITRYMHAKHGPIVKFKMIQTTLYMYFDFDTSFSCDHGNKSGTKENKKD